MSLPPGFRLVLDPGVRRIDGGTVLVGGSPLRILRLSGAGAQVVDSWIGGAPVASSDGSQRLARRLLDAGIAHPRPPRGTYEPVDVTVVVPVRDGEVVGAFDNRIVVDDGSRTPVPGAVRHPTPRGPAAARNTGWRQARTSLVAFVDADCVPEPGWLDTLLPHFADPLVAAVAPRIRSTGAGWLAAYDARRSPLDRGEQEGPVRPRGRVPFVPTAALIVRRSVLEELDGFDEALHFGEDVDLVWRMVEHGWTVRYEPAARVAHPTRPTLRAWLAQRFRYGSSAAPLARRHGRAVAPLAVSEWSALAWTVTALGWPALGTGVAASTGAMLAPRLAGLEHRWVEAGRLAGTGHWFAGSQIADALRRAWWPLAALAAISSKRARVACALAVLPVAPDPLRLLDDLAYGTGVWAGCVRERSWAALRPDLSNWPGRAQAVETASAAVTINSVHVSGGMTMESIFR